MTRTILLAGATFLLLAVNPAAAQTANASGPATTPSSAGANPGTPPSGGNPTASPDASASSGTTPQDRDLEKHNDKVQSICKGC